MNKLPKLIVILGPTASGKTDLALALAKKISACRTASGSAFGGGGEIVNADSRTIYRGMDIGTAKPQFLKKNPHQSPPSKGGGYPPPFEKGARGDFFRGIRHHLFDIANPDKRFSAADFKELAIKTINDIIARGNVPVLVGGTGLYIEAAVKNLPLGEAVLPNKKLRAQFEKDLKADRESALKKYYRRLLKLDPAVKIDSRNPRRVIRALEICLAGKKFSEQLKAGEPLFDALQIGIAAPREKLYERIGARTDKMMKGGLEKEVRALSKKYSWKSAGMSGIGYREWQDYFKNKISRAEVAENIKKDTQNYAKRQMTWWRRDKSIKWVDSAAAAEKEAVDFLAE